MPEDVKDVVFVKELIPSKIKGTKIIFTDLPTVDPGVAGQLWSNSGVLTIASAG